MQLLGEAKAMMRRAILLVWLGASATWGAETTVWQIGRPDGSYQEFAIAANYPAYAERFLAKPVEFEVGLSDNGPEFIAAALRQWLSYAEVQTLYIGPGSPWENGYAESFPSRLRHELLAREEFAHLAEARAYGTRYRMEYNHRRPHSALGYRTPAEFAAGWAASGFATLSPQPHSRTPEYNHSPVSQPVLS